MQINQHRQDSDGVHLYCSPGLIRLQVLDDRIVRVTYTLREQFTQRPSLMIVPQQQCSAAWTLSEDDTSLTLRTSALQLRVLKQTAAFTWLDAAGNLLVRESARGGKTLDEVQVHKTIFDSSSQVQEQRTADGVRAIAEPVKTVVDRTAYSTRLDLEFSPGEAIYGLGQHEEGILNYRGHCQYLYQQNMKVAVPMILSSRGWAILWDSYSLATFHDDQHGSYFWTDVDDEMDFYFIVGPEFDQIVRLYRRLTGRVPMLPRWAYGYIQSKEHYKSQEELLEIAREYRRRQIPLDCIVQDWQSWPKGWWGQKSFDPARYPDPRQLCDDLHAMNVRLMVSIWPSMRGQCPNQLEMRQHNFLLGNDANYDAFNPAARALYWKQCNDGIFRHGVDAWWCDCTEPFEADWRGQVKPQPWRRLLMNVEQFKKYLDPQHINAYSLLHSQGIYEGQRSLTAEKRVVNLTRSAYPGQQRYGTITWSGDVSARWDVLRKQIADGLNFCMTGNPRWTFDIGGFFVAKREQWFWNGDYPNGCDDPAYRELYVRWFQLGAFLPMFRSHGTDTPREVWRFGEPGSVTYDTLVRFLHLRYRLLPYIYSLAGWETHRDYTMMRALAFDFRHDPAALNIDDQFMFGPALLVCPVTQATTSRSVYLPAGCDWFDFWTGVRHVGGQTIRVDAPVDIMPLFVRAGAILPMGPIVQHSAEPLDAPLELRIYPGSDGRFDLYEDEGDSYRYEQGAFAWTPIGWNDRARRFTIGQRDGHYQGMPARRRFDVALVREHHGVGVAPTPQADVVVDYTGRSLEQVCPASPSPPAGESWG